MGDLAGWRTGPLETVAGYFTDGDWIETPFITNEGIRLIQTGNVGIGEYLDKPATRKYVSEATFRSLGCKDVLSQDLLICRLADPVGRACVIPDHVGRAITAVDCTIVRLDESRADRAFLRHWMSTPSWLNACKRVAAGTTRTRISRANLGSLEVPLPPVVEQRRIAEILDTIDEAIQASERLIAKLRDLRVALLTDTVWAVETAKPTSVRALADGDRGVVIGPFGSDLVAADYREHGVPVVFVQDIREGQLVAHRSRIFVSRTKARSLAPHRVEPGDIAITKMGLPPGIASLYPEAMQPGIVTADIIRLRCRAEVCEPAWIAEAINSPMFQAQVRAITGGVTRPKITLRDFRSMTVRMPELSVQREHLASLSAFDARLTAEIKSLNGLGQLRQGLSADLFSGRVRTVMS